MWITIDGDWFMYNMIEAQRLGGISHPYQPWLRCCPLLTIINVPVAHLPHYYQPRCYSFLLRSTTIVIIPAASSLTIIKRCCPHLTYSATIGNLGAGCLKSALLMLRLHVLQDCLNHVCVLIRTTQSAGLLSYLTTRANRCTRYLDLMIFIS